MLIAVLKKLESVGFLMLCEFWGEDEGTYFFGRDPVDGCFVWHLRKIELFFCPLRKLLLSTPLIIFSSELILGNYKLLLVYLERLNHFVRGTG